MASFVKRGEKYLARVIKRGYPAQNKTFDTLQEAKRWATSVEALMDGKEYQDTREADKLLVVDLIDKYIDAKLSKLGRQRSEYYRLKAIGARLGKYSIGNLTPAVISAFIDERLTEVAPATVEREINQLHGVFSHAISNWGLQTKNPCLGVPRPKFQNRRDRIITDEQLAIVLHELGSKNHAGRSPLMVSMAQLALETAMRRGELHKLVWSNVFLERRVLFLPTTKNGDPRSVPLSTKAVAILQSMPRTADKVFPDISYEAFSGVWKRACERAGVENFRFHDLRHMAVNRIAQKVPNIVELSRISGHRNLRNLERYYHTTPEQLAEKLG